MSCNLTLGTILPISTCGACQWVYDMEGQQIKFSHINQIKKMIEDSQNILNEFDIKIKEENKKFWIEQDIKEEERIKKSNEKKVKQLTYQDKVTWRYDVCYLDLIEEYNKWFLTVQLTKPLKFEKWVEDIYANSIINLAFEKNYGNYNLGNINMYKFEKVEIYNYTNWSNHYQFRITGELLPQYNFKVIENEVKNYRQNNK